MGISYQDVGMVNDSLDALGRAAVMKRASAREKRRDELDERRAASDETYRGSVLAGNQAEAAANRTFRTASAEAEKAHQDRLATQQGAHYKSLEEQNAERNALLKGGLDEKSAAERNARMQKHLDWLKDGVEKEVIDAGHANTLLHGAIAKAPPEMLAGTPFEGLPKNFFQAPPKKASERGAGKISIATDGEGKTTRTITRDLSPDDEKMASKSSPLEEAMAEATKEKITARIANDPKAAQLAQDKIDRIIPMMEEERKEALIADASIALEEAQAKGDPSAIAKAKEELARVKATSLAIYTRNNGVLSSDGSKGSATAPKPIQRPRASEVLETTGGGSYTTTPTTDDDIDAIVNQRAKIKELQFQLKNMGTSAPGTARVPLSTPQVGSGSRTATTQERQAHDARVRKLILDIAKEQAELERLSPKK